MPDMLVRNVPKETFLALKARAAQHRRSLQQEVLDILEASAKEQQVLDPAEVASAIRTRLSQSGRKFSDSTPSIREDRDR